MLKIKCYDGDGNIVNHIYQWDQNRYIELRDLDVWVNSTVYFNFSTPGNSTVYSVQACRVDDYYYATVPNDILEQCNPIVVRVYQTTAQNESMTISTFKISVVPRQRPLGYDYTPNNTPVRIADGIVNDGGTLYLVSDGEVIGDGTQVENSTDVDIFQEYRWMPCDTEQS